MLGAQQERRAKAQPSLEDGDEALSLFFVSCLPWLHYSAISQPTPFPADSNPRITWGKYQEVAGQVQLPVTLLVHHALVDGIHLARFFENLEKELRKF